MRIHTKIVYEWKDDELVCVEDEFYEHNGPVAECKKGQSGKQTVTTEPPKWMRPYMQNIASEAGNLYQNFNPTFFPGQTYAGFTPEQEQAMQLTTQRAMAGSPVTRAANQQAADTLGGNFLYGGEGFNAALDAASRKILPQLDSKFGAGGRLGSGLAATAQTQALGDAFAGLYNNERQRQMQTLGMSPMLAQQDYFDFGQLANVGAQRQAMEQAGIDESMARHEFSQNLPYQKLQNYAGTLGGMIPGAGNVQSQPTYRNRPAGVLGGALMGAKLGSIVPGIGTGIGALGGGILGGLL